MTNTKKTKAEEKIHLLEGYEETVDFEHYEDLCRFFAKPSFEVWTIYPILHTYLPMFIAEVCLNGLPYILTFRIEKDRLVLVDMFLLEGDPLVFSDEREYLEYFEKARQEFESLDMFSI